ncbi:serine/threonine-protein kinase [Nocardia sp. NPDC051756]|uniref:serine/threonine-protein kinase n=1 Tax=Nocardia sp. NPDC051756 TaxID=3154751 RepID=UPI00341B9A9B
MELAEGTLFAGYRIERRLGSDRVGTVFLAQHPRLPRKDALKILSDAYAGNPGFRARFLREAEAAARLQHPNLVTVRDRGEEDGRLWIAMQYVDGIDVAELLRRNPAGLDVVRAVHIGAEAARGLDEIHRAGLRHRDVKPASILVAAQAAGPDRVLVTGFGIAPSADDETTQASGGGMSATLAYAAPEQISGDPTDDRADVYSLGATLYHLFTGSVPFPKDSPGAVMFAHLNEPPPLPSQQNPRVPAGFDAVIAKAMAKNPGDRYPSCGALAAAAEAALRGVYAIETTPYAGRPAQARRRLLVGAAALAIALVVVLVSVLFNIDREERSAAPPTPSTTPPRPSSGVSIKWGNHGFAIAAFPNLLPATPYSIGYRELNMCTPVDAGFSPIAFDAVVQVDRLSCTGDQDPVEVVDVSCNTDRSPIAPAPPPDPMTEQVEGEEHWTRPSGAGVLRWGTYRARSGAIIGTLEISFEDPGRNFCRLTVNGGESGAQLRREWWTDAPL